MSSNTPNLGLLKKDPMVDGNETFNIETMLNDNWDKIDEAVGKVREDLGNVNIPDASLTTKGKVQLSNATDSTAENMAATPKAVNDAALQAKSYTDQQINLVTETGIPKLVSYPLLVTATADNQKVFEIPLDLFDANTDTLLVAINRAVLDATQYTVTNTVRNTAGEVTQRAKITLLSGVAAGSEVAMVVLKNVPIGPDGSINGAVLAANSVPINRVTGLQDQLDEAFQAGNERKAEVVAALVAIGVPASTNESWAQLIPKIAAVIRATGNATASDVLAGKTASNANGPFTGQMPNRSAENHHMPGIETTVWPGDRFFIRPPHGFYNGATWVTAAVPGLTANNLRAGVDVAGLVGTLDPNIKMAQAGLGTSPSGSITNLPFKPILLLISVYYDNGYVTLSGTVGSYFDGSTVHHIVSVDAWPKEGSGTRVSMSEATFGSNFVNFALSHYNAQARGYKVFGV